MSQLQVNLLEIKWVNTEILFKRGQKEKSRHYWGGTFLRQQKFSFCNNPRIYVKRKKANLLHLSNEDIQDDELRRKFLYSSFVKEWFGKHFSIFLGEQQEIFAFSFFCCWHFIATYNCVMIQVFMYFFYKDCRYLQGEGFKVLMWCLIWFN